MPLSAVECVMRWRRAHPEEYKKKNREDQKKHYLRNKAKCILNVRRNTIFRKGVKELLAIEIN